MGQRDVLLEIVRWLNRNKISYLLTGSLASSFYGFPRATHDIDFILEISRKDRQKLISIRKDLDSSYLIDINQVEEAVRKSSQFDIYHLETGIKLDFWIIGRVAFERGKFKRRKEITLARQKLSIISAEDLILTKLLWNKKIKSERHLRDCIGIWKVQKGKLDLKYLSLWAKRLKLEDSLSEISSMSY